MEFAQEPNTLHVKVWQTSWATWCVCLAFKKHTNMVSQSRKYCTCGFVAVLGNILNRPRYRKNLEVWHMPCAIQTEEKRISPSHSWLSNEFKASLDYQNTNKQTKDKYSSTLRRLKQEDCHVQGHSETLLQSPASKYKTDIQIYENKHIKPTDFRIEKAQKNLVFR